MYGSSRYFHLLVCATVHHNMFHGKRKQPNTTALLIARVRLMERKAVSLWLMYSRTPWEIYTGEYTNNRHSHHISV